MTRPLKDLSIADVARFPRPGTVVPGRLGFTPDGAGVTYLFSAEGSLVRSLWRYDITTGERRVMTGPEKAGSGGFSREEELRRERARLREEGVTDYQFARDARPLVLMVPRSGRLFVAVGDGPVRELPGIEGAIDPRLSRDGSQVAFIRDGELFGAPVAGGAPPRQLTAGAQDGLTNGLADFIHQEELDQDRGFWWSPDGTRIAYIQADSRHIAEYPIVHQGKPGIDVERHRYPFAGAANARLRLGVVAVETGETTWMELGPDEDIYVPRVDWRPDGGLTAQVLSRDQKSLRLVQLDQATGQPSTLIEERTEPWINVSHDARFLESGEILWSSERSGFRHLYLYDAAGAPLCQLTDGPWLVSYVVGVDEPRRLVYFVATKDSPLERHLYRVPLDGGETERLTAEPGFHGAVLSRDGDRFLDFWTTMRRSPSVVLRKASTGKAIATLHDAEVTASSLGLEPPEVIETVAADGTTPLFAALYPPTDRDPGRRYPLVVSVYGGPHAQRVVDDWSMTVDLRAQYLAQQGFAVLKVDNRGSAGRGLAFEAALDRRFGTVEVEDQVAGVRQVAANREFVDPARAGIYGWSYGGYMTLMCMLKEPGLFRVGVAGAPVTDWDGYDTGYTERYMGTPANNPDGYREGSVLTHVERLAGWLLLVHGMIDENVHFRHTGRLVVALAQAGKAYDVLLFPEERHMPRDQAGLEYQERRVLEFLRNHL